MCHSASNDDRHTQWTRLGEPFMKRNTTCEYDGLVCACAHCTTSKRMRGHILHWRAAQEIFKTYIDQSTKGFFLITHTTVTKQTQARAFVMKFRNECDKQRRRRTKTTNKSLWPAKRHRRNYAINCMPPYTHAKISSNAYRMLS